MGAEATKMIPWDVVLLLSGGFALSAGVEASGLSHWIGHQLASLSELPSLLLTPAICTMVMLVTNFTSNVAAANVFLPLLNEAAIASGKHPMALLLPGTLACSLCFMFPIATPPNAVAFGTGIVSTPRMAKVGGLLNLIGVVLVAVFVPTLGGGIYGF